MKSLMRDLFTAEHDAAWNIKRQFADEPARFVADINIQPLTSLTEEQYKEECLALPKDALPDAVLADDEDLPDKLELIFAPGDRCCVAVVPFLDGGYVKDDVSPKEWENFLYHRRHIKALRVYFEGLTEGYDDVPARYYNMLPEKIRADISEGGCTFKIEYPYSGEVNDKRNRQKFAEAYRQAYANLKKFLEG